jgi:hypothetical protein
MQLGQVPIQFVPDAPVSSTAAITLEADTGSTLIPSLQPFEEVKTVEIVPRQEFPTWIVIGGLIALVLFLSGKRG